MTRPSVLFLASLRANNPPWLRRGSAGVGVRLQPPVCFPVPHASRLPQPSDLTGRCWRLWDAQRMVLCTEGLLTPDFTFRAWLLYPPLRSVLGPAVPLGRLLHKVSSGSHLQPPACASNAPCRRGLKQQPGKALVVLCPSCRLKVWFPLVSLGLG